jgi:hypothetical protein
MLVKCAENQGLPPKELMDAIAILGEEAVQDRTMLGNAGLAPTAQGTRVRVCKGQLAVTDGPFTEAKEVIGGYAQFELKSKQEAIDAGVRFMELHRKYWPEWEGELEIRQMVGPEDFAQHVKELTCSAVIKAGRRTELADKARSDKEGSDACTCGAKHDVIGSSDYRHSSCD